MGGRGAGEEPAKKALRATSSAGDDGDGASVPPVEAQQPAPLPTAGVAGSGVADGSAAAVHQSCGGEEDDQADDEQVERFYALLANIRALRCLYSAGTGPAALSGRGCSRKRAREAEPPWTPAFRLEDFELEEEVNNDQGAADARCAVTNQGGSGGVSRRPTAAAAARARAAAVADDGHEEDEVARGGGNKLGRRRVAARG